MYVLIEGNKNRGRALFVNDKYICGNRYYRDFLPVSYYEQWNRVYTITRYEILPEDLLGQLLLENL